MRVTMITAAFLLAAPAFAAGDQAPKPAKPAKEKKVCKPNLHTGSRLDSGMICKTATEWEADAQAVQNDLAGRARGN